MPPQGEAFRLYGFLPFHHTPAGSLGQWKAADKMKGRSGVWAYDCGQSSSSSSIGYSFNSGKFRNSLSVMLKATAILCSVRAFGFLLVPRIMLSTVDCFRPLIVASRLIVMPCLAQSCFIRNAYSSAYCITVPRHYDYLCEINSIIAEDFTKLTFA